MCKHSLLLPLTILVKKWKLVLICLWVICPTLSGTIIACYRFTNQGWNQLHICFLPAEYKEMRRQLVWGERLWYSNQSHHFSRLWFRFSGYHLAIPKSIRRLGFWPHHFSGHYEVCFWDYFTLLAWTVWTVG